MTAALTAESARCRSTRAWRTRPACTTSSSAGRITKPPTGRRSRPGSRCGRTWPSPYGRAGRSSGPPSATTRARPACANSWTSGPVPTSGNTHEIVQAVLAEADLVGAVLAACRRVAETGGMTTSGRLRFVSDTSAASWIAAGSGPFGSGVGSLLPQGFEAYARILHPAWIDDAPVRWSQVAAWSGKVVHPRVQFAAAARRSFVGPSPSRPWKDPPAQGNMPPADLSHLCRILGGYTTSPTLCWFCLWDGYGWISNLATASARGDGSPSGGSAARQSTGNDDSPVPPVFTEESLQGPRVSLPQRRYFLFRGPLDAATELGWMLDDGFFIPQSPNLFWPDDHSWCVATEVDLDSTYLGGSGALVQRLLADRSLEVLGVEPSDPVDAGSDEINRLEVRQCQSGSPGASHSETTRRRTS